LRVTRDGCFSLFKPEMHSILRLRTVTAISSPSGGARP